MYGVAECDGFGGRLWNLPNGNTVMIYIFMCNNIFQYIICIVIFNIFNLIPINNVV